MLFLYVKKNQNICFSSYKKLTTIYLYILPFFLWIPFFLLAEETEEVKKTCANNEEFIETRHTAFINGKSLSYLATAGNLLLEDENCQSKASIFFISYVKEREDKATKRPITFCFNGGPGSSSVWLHLGVFGPRRIEVTEEIEKGKSPFPYSLVDNEFSILDQTDLVFIDPVSTGFSQAIPTKEEKNFHGVKEDIKSIAEFIRLYLSRYERWDSPKFIAGESYGTMRAAGLANHLHQNAFIDISGIILISSVLDLQTIDFYSGNDLPYLLYVPTYAATAWYHQKLSPDLQSNLDDTIKIAKDFVYNDYAKALFKGNLLNEQERKNIAIQLSRLTGLSSAYIEESNLRIAMPYFIKQLLHDQKKIVSRFDSRFTGFDLDIVGESCSYDPTASAIFSLFTSAFNQYVKGELKWLSNKQYKILTSLRHWDFEASNHYLNVIEDLRDVMTKNPHLQVFVGNGLYDLATPFFATEYTFTHLGLHSSLLDHVTMKYYPAGHMMYLYLPSLVQLKNDLSQYYDKVLHKSYKTN